VSCEALSPGEVQAHGGGVRIHYACADSVFGRFIVGNTARGICHLSFHAEGIDDEGALRALQNDWPAAQFVEDPLVARELSPQLGGLARDKAPLRLLLRGTNFQIKVWEALLRIPEGALLSYSGLAQSIGQPGAARAVGSALAANRIAVLIPCHRVIRETGAFGEYRWHVTRKQALIAREQAAASTE
jgi:AraC family transcriptional regulator of adaptative response/methylated-DNA-[protein]-cysteine methyltransferase